MRAKRQGRTGRKEFRRQKTGDRSGITGTDEKKRETARKKWAGGG
jgi:hypothetical protein